MMLPGPPLGTPGSFASPSHRLTANFFPIPFTAVAWGWWSLPLFNFKNCFQVLFSGF